MTKDACCGQCKQCKCATEMPFLPVDKMVSGLAPYEATLIRAAFHNTGQLRAFKPFTVFEWSANFTGSANYVWRILCFDYADFHPHSYTPVYADSDIPGDYDERQRKMDVLDKLIIRAESVVPFKMQKGLVRWMET